MYKSYYKRGFTPSKTNRYAAAKARIQSNIANRRAISIPRTIVLKNNGEKKGMDTNISVSTAITNSTSTNGDCFVLNLIQQGAGSWNRIGRNVYLHSLRLKGGVRLQLDVDSSASGNIFRMVVVWDKQPSGGAIPSFDTVFGRTIQDGTETCLSLDPAKFDNMGRFEIIRDKLIDLNPVANYYPSPGGGVQTLITDYHFDEYMKLNRRKVTYSGQSNPMTIADISTGALYIYFRVTNTPAGDAVTVRVTPQSVARLRYSDE